MSILSDIDKAKQRALRFEKARKLQGSLETLIPFNEKNLETYRKKMEEYIQLVNDLETRIKEQKDQLIKLTNFLNSNATAEQDALDIEKLALQIEKLKAQVAAKRKLLEVK